MLGGSPETISLGRPVEPPDVGAFQAGLTTSGSGSSGGSSAAGWSTTVIALRPASSPSSTPTITGGSARSTMPASSRSGSRPLTGWGVAPSFQQAIVATNHSIELGSAIVTRSPAPTPSSASRRAMRSVHRSSSARVTVRSAHVMAGRSGRGLGQLGQPPGVRNGSYRAGPYDETAAAA